MTKTTFSEREAIARIVDHEGYWERLDGLNHAIRSGLANDEQHMELCHTRDEEAAATKDSLEKADEILAIIARRAPAPPAASPVTVTIPPLKPDQAEYIAKAVRREPVDMDTVIGASPVTGALVEALRGFMSKCEAEYCNSQFFDEIKQAKAALAAHAPTQEKVATAYYDGFCDGIMRQPWEDAADWAALQGQEYAKTGVRPPFIPISAPVVTEEMVDRAAKALSGAPFPSRGSINRARAALTAALTPTVPDTTS